MKQLRLAPGLSLPVDVAGEAIAILAKRGAGKTNTATVLVEELADVGVQVVVVDPVGAWWGLRSSADGQNEGLSIPILGGEHGDVPLEQNAGGLIADVAVDTGASLLLDVSEFPTKASMERFVLDFADRLYRRKARARSLLHLVLEEADVFAPQSPKGGFKGDAGKMAYAIEQIVRRGRSRGIGITMVTQRSAVLNKDVLSQADILIAMRTTSPHDHTAIKAWVEAREEKGDDVVSLPSLETGEAWVWNPERGLLDRIKVRRRRTFDSSRTPKVGERRAEPRAAAPIDLQQLGEQIAATAEKAKAADPTVAQKRIRDLERELDHQKRAHAAHTEGLEARAAASAAAQEPELVEIPVISDEQMRELASALDHLDRMGVALVADLDSRLSELRSLHTEIRFALDRAIKTFEKHSAEEGRTSASAPSARTREAVRSGGHVAQGPRRPETPGPVAPPRARPGSTATIDGVELKRGARRMLEVLAAFHPRELARNQLATLAQVTKGGTFSSYLSNLRAAGLIDENGNDVVTLTELGRQAAGDVPPIQGPEQIIAAYQAKLKLGARRMLDILYEHPDGLTRDQLSELAEVTKGGTFSSYLSNLRSNGLVDERDGRLRLSDTLFLGVA